LRGSFSTSLSFQASPAFTYLWCVSGSQQPILSCSSICPQAQLSPICVPLWLRCGLLRAPLCPRVMSYPATAQRDLGSLSWSPLLGQLLCFLCPGQDIFSCELGWT
jgi:hypothetical protein